MKNETFELNKFIKKLKKIGERCAVSCNFEIDNYVVCFSNSPKQIIINNKNYLV